MAYFIYLTDCYFDKSDIASGIIGGSKQENIAKSEKIILMLLFFVEGEVAFFSYLSNELTKNYSVIIHIINYYNAYIIDFQIFSIKLLEFISVLNN
jgi:hypothetical protein